MEEVDDPNTGIEVGDRPVYGDGSSSKSGGSDEEGTDVVETDNGGAVTITSEEKYEILLSTYAETTESGLHGHLIANCGSCHRVATNGTTPAYGIHGERTQKRVWMIFYTTNKMEKLT